MIALEQIRNFFPAFIQSSSLNDKYMLKEYLQLMILDFLSTTSYVKKIVFIGGTNLRLVKSIDRFSEDLDFDCKELSKEEFNEMAGAVVQFLVRSGFRAEAKESRNERLTAFRSNIYFPELLFELGLTGHKEQRFLLKIETQDQGVNYPTVLTNIKGCGFFFPFPVPTDGVLCSMKIAAMLARSKGRDFYDLIFLLSQTQPDYNFLTKRCGIHNLKELKEAVLNRLQSINLNVKQKDFEHLLFNKSNSKKVLQFEDFINSLKG